MTGLTIGLVGLSTVARFAVLLLRPFGFRVHPYLTEADAEQHSVEKEEMDDLRYRHARLSGCIRTIVAVYVL